MPARASLSFFAVTTTVSIFDVSAFVLALATIVCANAPVDRASAAVTAADAMRMERVICKNPCVIRIGRSDTAKRSTRRIDFRLIDGVRNGLAAAARAVNRSMCGNQTRGGPRPCQLWDGAKTRGRTVSTISIVEIARDGRRIGTAVGAT